VSLAVFKQAQNKQTPVREGRYSKMHKGLKMSIKRIITVSAAFILSVSAARAGHVWSGPSGWRDGHFGYDINAPRYAEQEMSLDLFGSYINPEGKFNDLFDTNIRHGFWGGGVGLNYFFLREVGIGTDFNMSAKRNSDYPMFDDVVGNLTLRFPLGSSGLAPYAIGGGGRAIGGDGLPWQWIYGGGVGLEYRWNPTTGLFSDARFFWADKGTIYNRLLIRTGLRIVF